MQRHSVRSWAFSLSSVLLGHPKKNWRFAVIEMISRYLQWPLMLGMINLRQPDSGGCIME